MYPKDLLYVILSYLRPNKYTKICAYLSLDIRFDIYFRNYAKLPEMSDHIDNLELIKYYVSIGQKIYPNIIYDLIIMQRVDILEYIHSIIPINTIEHKYPYDLYAIMSRHIKPLKFLYSIGIELHKDALHKALCYTKTDVEMIKFLGSKGLKYTSDEFMRAPKDIRDYLATIPNQMENDID